MRWCWDAQGVCRALCPFCSAQKRLGEGISSPHVCGSAPALPWGPCVRQSCGHKHGCCSTPPGAKEATTTLHVLSLLRDVLPCCPAAAVKTCCETLLRVMTLSHVVSVLVSPCPRAWSCAGLQDLEMARSEHGAPQGEPGLAGLAAMEEGGCPAGDGAFPWGWVGQGLFWGTEHKGSALELSFLTPCPCSW